MLLLHPLLLALLISAPASLQQRSVPPAVEVRNAPAFDELFKQFNAAKLDWDKALEAANEARQKTESDGKLESVPFALAHPAKEFFARFDALAQAGNCGALRWCIQWGGHEDLALPERQKAKLARLDRLLALIADAEVLEAAGTLEATAAETHYGMTNFVGDVRTFANDIGSERACTLCDAALAKTLHRDELAPLVYYTQAQILIRAADGMGQLTLRLTDAPQLGEKPAPAPTRALELLKRVATEFPNSTYGPRAVGQLFKFERLQIGMLAPEVATKDVEDVEFKLSDYRGKVVVLDFWGFW